MERCVKCEIGRMGPPRYMKGPRDLEKLVQVCHVCGYEKSSPTADSKAGKFLKKAKELGALLEDAPSMIAVRTDGAGNALPTGDTDGKRGDE